MILHRISSDGVDPKYDKNQAGMIIQLFTGQKYKHFEPKAVLYTKTIEFRTTDGLSQLTVTFSPGGLFHFFFFL